MKPLSILTFLVDILYDEKLFSISLPHEIKWRRFCNFLSVIQTDSVYITRGIYSWESLTVLNAVRLQITFPNPWNISGFCVDIMIVGSKRCTSFGSKYQSNSQTASWIAVDWLVTLSPKLQNKKINAIDQNTKTVYSIISMKLLSFDWITRKENEIYASNSCCCTIKR